MFRHTSRDSRTRLLLPQEALEEESYALNGLHAVMAQMLYIICTKSTHADMDHKEWLSLDSENHPFVFRGEKACENVASKYRILQSAHARYFGYEVVAVGKVWHDCERLIMRLDIFE